MNRKMELKSGNYVFLGLLMGVLMLLLSACNTPTTVTTIPTVASAPTQVQDEATGEGPSVTVDLNGVAQSFTSQVVTAVPASAGGPYWEVMPQYSVQTMTGYPIADHLLKPQIFIYPVNELATANEGAGQIAANLQALLQNQQDDENLPFLPLFNASQVMHAQVKYQDFKNGKGVRYLTQFDQAPLPINNHELIYTYQGLTSDGRYYVAAVLPVNLASLPADEKVNGQEPPEFGSDFPKYLDNVVNTLNQQPASAFTPDLSVLDSMIQSIEIK